MVFDALALHLCSVAGYTCSFDITERKHREQFTTFVVMEKACNVKLAVDARRKKKDNKGSGHASNNIPEMRPGKQKNTG